MASKFDQTNTLVFSKSQTSETPFRSSHLEAAQKFPIYYSDLNSMFGQDGKQLLVYDEVAVNRQISNILSTPLGSDDFEPTFGSLLPFRMFDPITPRMAWILRNDSIEAVRKWMGDRIELDSANANVTLVNGEVDGEGYIIDMPYTIKRSKIVGRYTTALVR